MLVGEGVLAPGRNHRKVMGRPSVSRLDV